MFYAAGVSWSGLYYFRKRIEVLIVIQAFPLEIVTGTLGPLETLEVKLRRLPFFRFGSINNLLVSFSLIITSCKNSCFKDFSWCFCGLFCIYRRARK